MSASVKLGSPLKSQRWYIRLKRYINEKHLKFKLGTAKLIRDYMVWEKFFQIVSWIFNTLITGGLIYYILDNDNFVSYGATVLLALYYLDVIVQIIKKPYQDKK